ncbi:MAG: PCRF domain-containing protein, partial [Candidatus Marinimicrobia bacterium]|nr:PCRF domain-containing protein [Candidatus Neomarinimicrobiota bacterium]
MKAKIQNILDKISTLIERLSEPNIVSDIKEFTRLSQEHNSLLPVAEKGKEYLNLLEQLDENEEILTGDDEELIELAQEELTDIKADIVKLEEQLKV